MIVLISKLLYRQRILKYLIRRRVGEVSVFTSCLGGTKQSIRNPCCLVMFSEVANNYVWFQPRNSQHIGMNCSIFLSLGIGKHFTQT